MFTSLKVSGFRGLKSLKVERLGRVNLVVGQNNSGKTSLLEAVFLLAHGGKPDVALNANVVRGGVGIRASTIDDVRALWQPLFSDLDVSRPVSISASHATHGSIDLEIEHRYSARLGRASTSRDTNRGVGGSSELRFALRVSPREGQRSRSVQSRALFGEDGGMAKVEGEPLVVPGVLLKSCADSPEDDIKRLGLLRVRKQAELVVEALQIIEPKLQAVDGFPGPGGYTLWGDIGLPEQIPLAVLGDGVNRLARLVLAMAHERGLVVLVDEIENGFHHSVLEKVWKAVYTTAERFDAQVIATTHSYECIAAAHAASPGHDLILHRLDADDDGVRCVTYDSESIGGAMHHGFEVR
ncbi:MAG: AAA family ATPase [Gemmatimonadota bacterium]|nr:AAA family ATPase [Gemmatimonadota bacterium]